MRWNSYNNLCEYKKPKGWCEFRAQGWDRGNCPFLRTGIFKNKHIKKERDLEPFYNRDILSIFRSNSKEQAIFLAASKVAKNQCINFWKELADIYSTWEEFSSIAKAIVALMDENVAEIDKAIETIKACYCLLELKTNVDDKNIGLNFIISRVLDFTASNAKSAIQATDYYQGASNKSFILFGIDILKEVSSKIIEKVL